MFVHQPLEQHFVDHAKMAHIHLAVAFEVVTRIAALAGNEFFLDRLQRYLRHVAARLEAAFLVEHVGDAAGHARCEVATGHPEHDDRPAGHVLATMITDTLDDGGSARVADGKALAGDTSEKGFAFGCTVENGIADDDVVRGFAPEAGTRTDDDPPTRQALADIVVGFANQVQGHAARQKRAEGLAGGAREMDVDGSLRQACVPVAPGYPAREHGPDCPIDIADRQVDVHLLTSFERRFGKLDELIVQRPD